MSRVAVFLLLIATTTAADLSAAAQNQSTGSILSGVVRNGWSHAPLRRAIVSLSTTGSDPLEAVTYSDSNGAFAFSGVPPGEYVLCARVRAYDRACYGGTTERGRPLPRLFVRSNQNRQDIILAALPLGSISGTVRDSDGDPVPNAQVHMLHPVWERQVLHWRNAEPASTDSRGEFHISFVRPGRYRFLAERRFVPATRILPDVSYGQKPVEELYKPQYYPNSDSLASAETLILNAGNELKSIDFTLAPVERAIVAGRLILPASAEPKQRGDEAENVPVTLFLIPESGNETDTNSAGAAPPDFAFNFNSVQPGNYRLLALVHLNDRSYFASEDVAAGNNSENLALTLVPGSPLSGHLKLEGNGAQEHGPYKVRLISGDEGRFLSDQPTADVKPDGSFQFDDIIPGLWDIGVEPIPPGGYLKSMTLGQQDVLREEMILKPGTRQPLNIVLNMDGAIIKGSVVEDAAGEKKSASRAVVLLAPSGKFENVLSFYESQIADDTGHFEFKSVTPGRYKIYAFDRMELNEYQDPEFLKPYREVGEAFDVGDSARLDRTTPLTIRGESGSQ